MRSTCRGLTVRATACALATTLGALASSPAPALGAARFDALGFWVGSIDGMGKPLSDDGRVVVGTAFLEGGPRAVRVDRGAGTATVVDGLDAWGLSVSGDGSIALGVSGGRGFAFDSRGGSWLTGDAAERAVALAASADGSRLAGWVRDDRGAPVPGAWDTSRFDSTIAGFNLDLGVPRLFAPVTRASAGAAAFDISADGSVLVGASTTGALGAAGVPTLEAVRWVDRAGSGAPAPERLGTLPTDGPVRASSAMGVSPDGAVIVGTSIRTLGADAGAQAGSTVMDAFLWRDGAMVALGGVPGVRGDTPIHSVANHASAGGGLVVGASVALGAGGGYEWTAWVWDAAHGLRSLRDALVREWGVQKSALDGWTLLTALDVSADGRFLAGQAINPHGELEGFVVSVPAPGAGSVALLALGAVVVVRRGGGRR